MNNFTTNTYEMKREILNFSEKMLQFTADFCCIYKCLTESYNLKSTVNKYFYIISKIVNQIIILKFLLK